MATSVQVQVLDVGQGSGNLVQVYDGSTLTELMLVDLGSSMKKDTSGEASVKFVIEQLRSMPGGAVLAALVLSHGDVDHLNLIGAVLKAFSPPGTQNPPLPLLTIRCIWFGGTEESYKKQSSNVLVDASNYLDKGKPATFTNDAKGWRKSEGRWVPFLAGDVSLYLLAGNTTAETASHGTSHSVPSSYATNMHSLVVSVCFHGAECVLTGDATALTLAFINTTFENLEPIEECFMLTMPHHGSAATALDLKGSTATTPEKNLNTFAKNMNARTICASASERTDYRHPSMEVMKYFWEYLDSDVVFYEDPLLPDDLHYYTAYFTKGEFRRLGKNWPEKDGWDTVQTKANIFTTDYFSSEPPVATIIPPSPATRGKAKKSGKPPKGVRWEFGWDTTGAWVKPHAVTAAPFALMLRPGTFIPFLPSIPPPRQSVSPLRHLQSYC